MQSRQQYKIGELAQCLNIKQFVIRFWEKEFNIKPKRSEGGHRFYTQEDFNKFILIKELLYEKKFTVQGAKKELTSNKRQQDKEIIPSQRTTLQQNNVQDNVFHKNLTELRTQLLKLRELL